MPPRAGKKKPRTKIPTWLLIGGGIAVAYMVYKYMSGQSGASPTDTGGNGGSYPSSYIPVSGPTGAQGPPGDIGAGTGWSVARQQHFNQQVVKQLRQRRPPPRRRR